MDVSTVFKMAYRNVVRNYRRSLITGAAVMFAVFFASSMRCLQEGAWGYLVGNLVGKHFGYLQVQNKDYLATPSLDVALAQDQLESVKKTGWPVSSRIQNFALSSLGERTKAILCIGIEADEPNEKEALSTMLVRGTANLEDDGNIVLASGVAEALSAGIGDTIVLLSQGRYAANAVGQYRLSGIIELGSPEFNNQFVYISLADAQRMFAMEQYVSYAVIGLDDEDELEQAKNEVSAVLSEDYVVRDYKALLPGIMQAREFDKLSGRVIITVLYLLIGFGVFGTIIMMLKERNYEFGILKAIGMKTNELYAVLLSESVIIALLGSLAGIFLAMPIIYFFQVYPIEFTGEYAEVYQNFGLEAKLPFEFDLGIMFRQACWMALITIFFSLYAWWKIAQLQAVKAMRS